MNRKLVLLNVALVALLALLGWQLRQRRLGEQAKERAVLQKPAHKQTLLPPPAPAPVKTVAPAEYIDTVQKMLFSKDRNPNVIVEVPPPPKPPPPPPPMPALPHYFGQIRFGGDPVVILSAGSPGDQKGYAVGEKVGDFKVVSFDLKSITFEWNGQQVVRELAELKPKTDEGQASAPPASGGGMAPPAQASTASSSGGTIVSIGSSHSSNGSSDADSSSKSDVSPQFGVALPGGRYGCKNGDTSPTGTEVNGFRKTSIATIMGKACMWEPVK